MHTSTASLVAEFLRGRDAPYNKVFCWLWREEGVFKTSPATAPGTRLINATFPFLEYDAPGADRMAIFADWLLNSLAKGAPELGIDGEEIEVLKRQLAERHYIYVRTDELKQAAGEPRCEVTYEHSPANLVVTARCKLPNGHAAVRTFEEHPLIRNELAYAGAISRCRVGSDGKITVEPLDGFR